MWVWVCESRTCNAAVCVHMEKEHSSPHPPLLPLDGVSGDHHGCPELSEGLLQPLVVLPASQREKPHPLIGML